jgi:predicted nucleic acid-binding Zn ribbon protein
MSDERRCETCGASLQGRSPRARFCCKQCKDVSYRSGVQPVAYERCLNCGDPIPGELRRGSRFCSVACRKGLTPTAKRPNPKKSRPGVSFEAIDRALEARERAILDGYRAASSAALKRAL